MLIACLLLSLPEIRHRALGFACECAEAGRFWLLGLYQQLAAPQLPVAKARRG